MSAQIGAAGPQIQQNVIQNSVQQNAKQAVEQKVRDNAPNQVKPQQDQNQNFQKLAEQVLANRANGTEVQKPSVERGQVVDLLV
jgi:hypothetical protein